MNLRYFLFHASLAIALAIRGDATSPDLPKWQSDIEVVRATLKEPLKGDPLSARCMNTLDHLLPANMGTAGPEASFPAAGDTVDFSFWPMEEPDFGSFGWPDVEPNI